MSQFHFDPATYAAAIREELPRYEELQERVAEATADVDAASVLDLGAGTGATIAAVRRVHPDARFHAVDESPRMLARIGTDVQTTAARLQDPLPDGPFDVVVSALAVHHLDAQEKRELFRRVHGALRPGGVFVLGDVVVAPVAVAPLSEGYDKPDSAADQLEWLREAGFAAELLWEQEDLAVIRAARA